MSSAIAVKDLTFSYAGMDVLKGLSLNITAGDFFIIIGPNGSGKTTLMKLLCGIMKPENGGVNIFGRPQKHYSRKELARKVAMVQQLSSLDFPFTVQEVVLLGRTPHLGMIGLEKAADLDIAEQSMAFTGVELSGGEQQLTFIARAICQRPEMILLDEPTASLDMAHQVRVMDLMEKLKKEQNTTVVMISHDVNLAAMYANTLLLLRQGRIDETGAPCKVLNHRVIEKVFGCKVVVDTSPVGTFPRITPVPGKCIDNHKRH